MYRLMTTCSRFVKPGDIVTPLWPWDLNEYLYFLMALLYVCGTRTTPSRLPKFDIQWQTKVIWLNIYDTVDYIVAEFDLSRLTLFYCRNLSIKWLGNTNCLNSIQAYYFNSNTIKKIHIPNDESPLSEFSISCFWILI